MPSSQMSIKNKIKKKKEAYNSFVKKYEAYLMPVFLTLGFIVDTFTLRRVDQVFDNVILLTYLVLAAISIVVLYSYFPSLKKIRTYAPLLMQYAFGGLFSGLVIFYFKSSSFIISFPFLIILVILFIGNDFLHRKYQKLLFQTVVFYIAVFSYSILIVPILIKRINIWTFLLGSLVSLIIIYSFIWLLKKVTVYKKFFKQIYIAIPVVFSLFVFLYVTNIIPPIPLSLKESYVAHDVTPNFSRDTSKKTYSITLEDNPWYIFWSKYSRNLHIGANEPVYVFSSVFAPTDLKSTIFHEWSFFDSATNRWEKVDNIPMEIIGGQEDGYRGYSYKQNMSVGTWRVDIETQTGQIIGRIIFEINRPTEEISLTKVIK
jgi:hypothetical protein